MFVDAEDGSLASLQALKYSQYSSPLITLKETEIDGQSQQVMEVSNDDSQIEIVLEKRSSRPPAPPVDLGIRGTVPFRDRVLAPVTGKLADTQSKKFKQMAIDAAKKNDSDREQRARQLKEKMGVR